ncbi:MAG: hypothetical protein Q8Q09_28065 [Deltaproteobacteria bacterium]|nr:hypothetical protein [Deltaproteobacteria bacterium]
MNHPALSAGLLGALVCVLSGCPAPTVAPTDASTEGSADAVDAGMSLDDALTADASADQAEPPVDACDALFGVPNARTGLSAARCQPACGCGASRWTAPTFDAARLASLRAYRLLDAVSEITVNPYLSPARTVPDGAVCAVVVVDRAAHTYRLQDFASAELALAAGAHVTHGGVCGVCSSLEDFAVYAERPDLTEPVRTCGLRGGGHEGLVTCLRALGFTLPCAQVWAFNTENTRDVCGEICIRLLAAPYNLANGQINACLACDETRSGEVFKAVAGRTRRNSGTPSAMCRPCSETLRIAHDYP